MTKSVFSDAYGYLRHHLAQARRDAGLTQADLAERLGRPQSFVSKYERGERRLDVVELVDVADALGLDPLDVVKAVTERMERLRHREQRL